MRFAFNERKTAQAAAYLCIRRHGGPKSYMALLKLLYLADRRSLVETGRPITGDRMVSMPHGTVLSRTYDRIASGEDRPSTPWSEYVSDPVRYEVEALREDTDELSTYELRVLDQTHEKFGNLDQWGLRELTHGLPEYEDPHGSSITIRPADILRATDVPEDEIQRLSREAEAAFRIRQFADG